MRCGVDCGQLWRGKSPLFLAALSGRTGVINVLVKHCDVNQLHESGKTPLAIAAMQGHLDAVKALLAAGATPSDEMAHTAELEGHNIVAKVLRAALNGESIEAVLAASRSASGGTRSALRQVTSAGEIETK